MGARIPPANSRRGWKDPGRWAWASGGGEKSGPGTLREWREWPRVLVNVYRWDLERKNQLDAPLDIGLYPKLIDELEKMKTG